MVGPQLEESMSRALKPEFVAALMPGINPGPISEAKTKAEAGLRCVAEWWGAMGITIADQALQAHFR
jgi:hypothetical protein